MIRSLAFPLLKTVSKTFPISSLAAAATTSLLLYKSYFNFALKAKPNKKAQVPFKNWSIVKGDKVKIRTGK